MLLPDDPDCPVSEDVGCLEAAVSAIEADGVAVDRLRATRHAFNDVRRVGQPLISAATSPGRTEEELEALQEIISDPSADETLRMRFGFDDDSIGIGCCLQRGVTGIVLWSDFFTGFDVLLALSLCERVEHQHEGNLYTRTLTVTGGSAPMRILLFGLLSLGMCICRQLLFRSD